MTLRILWLVGTLLGAVGVVGLGVETAVAICPNTKPHYEACPQPPGAYQNCEDYGSMACNMMDGTYKYDGFFGIASQDNLQAVPGTVADEKLCYRIYNCQWNATDSKCEKTTIVSSYRMPEYKALTCDGAPIET